jgi:hypothetical protein
MGRRRDLWPWSPGRQPYDRGLDYAAAHSGTVMHVTLHCRS